MALESERSSKIERPDKKMADLGANDPLDKNVRSGVKDNRPYKGRLQLEFMNVHF